MHHPPRVTADRRRRVPPASVALAALLLVAPLAAFPAPAAAAPVAEWTLIVFLNADNDLDEAGVADFNEMEAVGSSDRVQILVCLDRRTGPAGYYRVERDDDPRTITSPKLVDAGELDMGDWRAAAAFAAWCVARHPARRYMLEIWNHGSGWMRGRPGAAGRAISWDETSGRAMTTEDQALLLAEANRLAGRRLDLYACDACLMQMAEIAWSVAPHADYLLASEDLVPRDGWAYDLALARLSAKPAMGPLEFSAGVIETFAERNSDPPRDGTMSLVDLAAFAAARDDFGAFSGRLADALADPGFRETWRWKARNAVRGFWRGDNVDLVHLASLTRDVARGTPLETASLRLIEALTTRVVRFHRGTGANAAATGGIAIYLPASGFTFDESYATLPFAGSGWLAAIRAFCFPPN